MVDLIYGQGVCCADHPELMFQGALVVHKSVYGQQTLGVLSNWHLGKAAVARRTSPTQGKVNVRNLTNLYLLVVDSEGNVEARNARVWAGRTPNLKSLLNKLGLTSEKGEEE